MNSVGIDLHKSRSHIAVVDEQGRKIVSRRIENDPATFLELLEEVDGESKIAVEATYGWEWLADVLGEAGFELHLAHPLRTKGDRLGKGVDRLGRRADIGAPAAHRSAPGGLYRAAGVA